MDRGREESQTDIINFENRAPTDGDSDEDSSALPQFAGGVRNDRMSLVRGE